MSIQTALSVGDPVKNLETSELKDLVALNPMTMSTTPPTSSAKERNLFIMTFQKFVIYSSCSLAAGDKVGQDQHERYHQQDMDYPSARVTGYETEQPQNDQDYCNCV